MIDLETLSVQVARQIQIHASRAEWSACHAVIRQARAEAAPLADPRLAELGEIGLPTRLHNALEAAGWHTVAGVLPLTDADLLAVVDVGEIGLKTLDKALADLSLRRRPDCS